MTMAQVSKQSQSSKRLTLDVPKLKLSPTIKISTEWIDDEQSSESKGEEHSNTKLELVKEQE
jgi:hypothetical protein